MKAPRGSVDSDWRRWVGPTIVAGAEVIGTSVVGMSPHSQSHDALHYCLEDPTDETSPWVSTAGLRVQIIGKVNLAHTGPKVSTQEMPPHTVVAAEINALKSEVMQLRGELHGRLRELERKVDDLLAAQDFDVEEIPVDPHTRWIERNWEQLRTYPDSFVALDPERGILVHATEQDEFAKKLEGLTAEENERVTLFHTSMYLRS